MNPKQTEEWKARVLDEIFAALAASEEIGRALIYKGARVLSRRLSSARQSFDLDSNFNPIFLAELSRETDRKTFLESEIAKAVRRHFDNQQPVRYSLVNVTANRDPKEDHPRGWNAYIVKIKLVELSKRNPAIPAIEIDVAAPEALRDSSVSMLEVGANSVSAYTLERIAGEKLRAFLSSLPAYRTKLSRPGDAVRAKDLYDLALIRRAKGVDDTVFWTAVAEEFRSACESRFVDCDGMDTFLESWPVTEQTYASAIIPKDISIREVRDSLEEVIGFFREIGLLPFHFDLPDVS